MAQPIRALITGNRLENEHTEYLVELHAGNAKLSTVSRRYREFTELHAQLCKYRHAFGIPELPPKKFFGRTNPSFVLKRQKELQVFLDQLVQRIIANPPAEAAWRLLCLFLALDPKQDIPEAIVSSSTAQSAPLDNHYDTSGSAAMLAVPDAGDVDGQHDTQNLEVEEIRRMEKIVEDFARQTINVSRHSEERLQHPPSSLTAQLSLSGLSKALETHLLSSPLSKDTAEDSQEDEDVPKGESLVEPFAGADDLIVSLDRLSTEPDTAAS